MATDILMSVYGGRFRAALFCLIVVNSLLVALFYQPYVTSGPQLVQNPVFSNDFSHWHKQGDVSLISEGGVRLNGSESLINSLSQMIVIPPDVQMMALSVSARSDSIVKGTKGWNLGRVVLTSYPKGTENPDWNRPHLLFELVGTKDWKAYQKLFRIYPNADRAKIQIQLAKATGILEAKRIQLYSAAYKDSWWIFQTLMLLACFFFLIWIFLPYLQGNLGWIGYSVIASTLLIVIFTTMPVWLKQDIYNCLKDGVGWLKDVTFLTNHALTDVQADGEQATFGIEATSFFSIMHFLFFMTAGYILLKSVHDFSVTQKLYDLFTLAVITECMQVFVEHRGPSVVDVGVDMAGVVVGLLIWVYWGKVKANIGAR